MKPAFGGGWKNVHKIHSLDELLHHYNESGTLTMMLQEFITWDTYIRVPTIGRRWARAIRYDPAPGGMGGYNQDYDILPRALRDKAEELSLRFNVALGYDMNALEFAVKDGKFYGIDLTNYTPDLDYRSLKDAHFPWAVEKMASFAVEKALSGEPTPTAPDWKALLLHDERQRLRGARPRRVRRAPGGERAGEPGRPRLRRARRAAERAPLPEPRRQLQRRARGAALLPLALPYHALLTTSWPRFFLVVAAGYFAANLVFAFAYLACGPDALEGARATTLLGRFEDAFFFSVQTLATIGYGRMSPAGRVPNLLVTVEALVGLMGFALATGLLFARFSRPTARIVFSDRAVVAPFRGGTALMFRLANERSSQLTEVSATVSVSRLEETPDGRVRRFHELRLDRAKVVFLPLHWVVVHPIDETSPLFGVSADGFRRSEAEILILLSGIDETFSQTVHARSSYRAEEVVWGARFADMFLRTGDGLVGVDMRKLHDIEPV